MQGARRVPAERKTFLANPNPETTMIIIDHEDYGVRSTFESIEDFETALASCGDAFDGCAFRTLSSGNIVNERNEVVGQDTYWTASATPYATHNGLRIYDLDPKAGELYAVAGPDGFDPASIDPEALPDGFIWISEDMWAQAVEASVEATL